ncbi:MAG: formylglycine-generating enzyme family protein [Bacteroidota bacterium]
MKYVVPITFSLLLFFSASAQNASENFKSYEQTLPGSTLHFKMVPIKSGEFLLGSPATEKRRDADEGPQQKIKLSAFWMGTYEVTRDEFDVFYKDETTSENADMDAITRPSPQYIDFSWGMGKEGGYPVNSLSQFAALMYCRWLYQKTGIFYRLPTEAEWEYACRAGSTTAYYFGDDSTQLDKYAWYSKNSEDKFQKVGQKLPNAWGLYDMLGNVLEWTLEHYDARRYEKIKNPTDPAAEPSMLKYPKVLRGGGFAETAGELRSANRFASDPIWNRRDPQIPKSKWWITDARWIGFRVVRPLKQPSTEEINLFYQTYLGR